MNSARTSPRYISLKLLLAIFFCSNCLQVYSQNKIKTNPSATAGTSRESEVVDRKVIQIPADSVRSVENLSRYIKTYFLTDEERVRALYKWLSFNIAYDVDNLYAFEMSSESRKTISDVFVHRKAICQGYAMVFTTVCENMGIPSYLISGYTKVGQTLDLLPHAWSAARLDGHWYLFDPTWGAGTVEQNMFVRQPNEVFFRITAEEFIPTHMPFDPLWQFLNYPILHRNFMKGKTQLDPTTGYFNFEDSIRVYNTLPALDCKMAEARRIEQNGVHNDMTFNYLSTLKQNIQIEKQNILINKYNIATNLYNHTLQLANGFIGYRNNLFIPSKTEPEVRAMLDSVAISINQIRAITTRLQMDNEQNRKNLEQLKDAVAEIEKNLNEQQLFIDKYYKTPKLLRRFLFYK